MDPDQPDGLQAVALLIAGAFGGPQVQQTLLAQRQQAWANRQRQQEIEQRNIDRNREDARFQANYQLQLQQAALQKQQVDFAQQMALESRMREDMRTDAGRIAAEGAMGRTLPADTPPEVFMPMMQNTFLAQAENRKAARDDALINRQAADKRDEEARAASGTNALLSSVGLPPLGPNATPEMGGLALRAKSMQDETAARKESLSFEREKMSVDAMKTLVEHDDRLRMMDAERQDKIRTTALQAANAFVTTEPRVPFQEHFKNTVKLLTDAEDATVSGRLTDGQKLDARNALVSFASGDPKQAAEGRDLLKRMIGTDSKPSSRPTTPFPPPGGNTAPPPAAGPKNVVERTASEAKDKEGAANQEADAVILDALKNKPNAATVIARAAQKWSGKQSVTDDDILKFVRMNIDTRSMHSVFSGAGIAIKPWEKTNARNAIVSLAERLSAGGSK